jgi:hypothetical protein
MAPKSRFNHQMLAVVGFLEFEQKMTLQELERLRIGRDCLYRRQIVDILYPQPDERRRQLVADDLRRLLGDLAFGC